ncbi:DNA damage-binding protein 2 [Homalodisca vitripennis]|nr:DNA damage-binding protein 2 [Homalodisca vitripennis]
MSDRSDGCRLLTTDLHDQLRVYRAPSWVLEHEISHPHRCFQHMTGITASWHPAADLFVIGRYPDPKFDNYDPEMRCVDIFSASTGKVCYELMDSSKLITSLTHFNSTGSTLATSSASTGKLSPVIGSPVSPTSVTSSIHLLKNSAETVLMYQDELCEKLKCMSGLLDLKMTTCRLMTNLVLDVYKLPNLTKILKKLNSLCSQTIDQMSEISRLSWSSVQRILTEDLGMKRVAAKFVPWYCVTFFLFPCMKRNRFDNIEEVKKKTREELSAIPKDE